MVCFQWSSSIGPLIHEQKAGPIYGIFNVIGCFLMCFIFISVAFVFASVSYSWCLLITSYLFHKFICSHVSFSHRRENLWVRRENPSSGPAREIYASLVKELFCPDVLSLRRGIRSDVEFYRPRVPPPAERKTTEANGRQTGCIKQSKTNGKQYILYQHT